MPQPLASADQVKEAFEHASVELDPVLPAAKSLDMANDALQRSVSVSWTLMFWDPPTHCSLL